jgi:hypothetical protein
MAYSRWDRSFWFTYYDGSFGNSRRRKDQLFCIRTKDPKIEAHFSYLEIKLNRIRCFQKIKELVLLTTDDMINELNVYMNWFEHSIETDISLIN